MAIIRNEETLRRIIYQTLRKVDANNSQLPNDYQILVDSTRSVRYRIFWFCVLFSCLVICCYQISDRVSYYLSDPVAVDIHIDDVKSFNFPVMEICSFENDYFTHAFQDQFQENMFTCIMPIMKIWFSGKQIDFSKVFYYGNKSNVMDKLHFEKNIILENLNVSTRATILGQCTSFDINETLHGRMLRFKMAIKLLRNKRCNITMKILAVKDKAEFVMIDPLASGFIYDIQLIARKYHFDNTRKHPCVSDEEFIRCYRKSVIKKLADKATCRLSFFDSSINVPSCTNLEQFEIGYIEALNTFVNPNVYSECTPTCNQIMFTYVTNIYPSEEGDTIFKFSVNPLEVAVTQRLAYDEISLLIDTGGSLGLFLGLSLLSIIDIFLLVIVSAKSKKNTLNRIETLIFHTHMRCKRSNEIQNIELNQLSSKKKDSHLNYVWIFVLVLCFALVIFMIQERVKYYLKIPIRNVIELRRHTRVTYPSLTLCGENEKIAFYKKKIVKKKTSNVTNWCNLQLLDLYLKEKRYTLDYLWKTSKVVTIADKVNSMKHLIQSKC